MKLKKICYIVTIFLVIFYTMNLFAYKRRKSYFSRPQVGAWFGPITPLGNAGSLLKTNLGGGIFARFTFPYQYLKFGVDASYHDFMAKGVSHKKEGVNELQFVPVYGSLIFQIPVDFPVRFQFKAGVGTGYLFLRPDNIGQWDPIFTGGFEVSFPAGRRVNIGLRIDYIYIYEKFIKGSKYGGHVLDAGISLYFNI